MSASRGRLVILSGPSCVGKSPLVKALKRFYPELAATLRPLVLYNSRAPRPGEQDGVEYHFRVRQTHKALAEVSRLGIFVSPLSKDEIVFLRNEPRVSLPNLVRDVMRRKLLRRTRRQKGEMSLKDLEEVERRAGSAYTELGEAHHFDHVIPNHDGEDSDNWDAFYYPLGDARRTLLALAGLLRGEAVIGVERWDAGCPPDAPP